MPAEGYAQSRLMAYLVGIYIHRLERVRRGRARYVLKPGTLQQPERQAAFARGIQQTVQLMNECLEHGVVRWVPNRKAQRK